MIKTKQNLKERLKLNKRQLKGMILRAKKARAKGYDIILSMARDLSVSPDEIVKALEKNRIIGMTENSKEKAMKLTRSKLKEMIREEIRSLKEDYDYDKIDLKKPYGVFLRGGSIGSGRNSWIDRKTGAKLVSTFDDEGNAKRIAKTRQRRLSPGEKKYYGMKYTAIKMSRVKLVKA